MKSGLKLCIYSICDGWKTESNFWSLNQGKRSGKENHFAEMTNEDLLVFNLIGALHTSVELQSVYSFYEYK